MAWDYKQEGSMLADKTVGWTKIYSQDFDSQAWVSTGSIADRYQMQRIVGTGKVDVKESHTHA